MLAALLNRKKEQTTNNEPKNTDRDGRFDDNTSSDHSSRLPVGV